MDLMVFDVLLTVVYLVTMVALGREMRVLSAKERKQQQTVPLILAVTVAYVTVLWKTNVLVNTFTAI